MHLHLLSKNSQQHSFFNLAQCLGVLLKKESISVTHAELAWKMRTLLLGFGAANLNSSPVNLSCF